MIIARLTLDVFFVVVKLGVRLSRIYSIFYEKGKYRLTKFLEYFKRVVYQLVTLYTHCEKDNLHLCDGRVKAARNEEIRASREYGIF
jgi:hypothetical protein